jgi:hypothetical protein
MSAAFDYQPYQLRYQYYFRKLLHFCFERLCSMLVTHIRPSVCLGALLILSACNQPAVSIKAPAVQDSENTVRDWHVAAHRVTDEMAARGLLPAALARAQPQPSSNFRPVHVRVESPESAFLKEVAGEVQAEVLRRGGTVARTPTTATVVNLGVDFVRWSPRDKPPAPLIAAGTAGALLTGAALASAAPYSTAGALAAAGITAGAWGLASDAVLAMTPMSNTEAILQATIVTRDSVVM